jgi:16S rRNA (uracil1498-N3)-methyltransferase
VHWFYDPTLGPESRTLQAESQHLKSLRIEIGEQFTVTNGLGLVGICELLDKGDWSYKLKELRNLGSQPIKFHLIQALAKNDRDELGMQTAVELGAASITPWQAERSIVRWDSKEQKNRNRWQQIAIEAMKQSQQGYLAEVKPLSKTSALSPLGIGLVLDPRSTTPISEIPAADEYTIVVGPEGGISKSELEKLVAAGFELVKLGDSVLRASTAGPAAIAALQALHGSFRS